MQLEGGYDYLFIYEANFDYLLASLDGYDMPDAIVSTGNRLTIRFYSDGSFTEQGFEAYYYTGLQSEIVVVQTYSIHQCKYLGDETLESTPPLEDEEASGEGTFDNYEGSGDPSNQCGGTLTEQSGMIVNPGYPGNYGNNRVCGWLIRAPSDQVIQVTFSRFQVSHLSWLGHKH